jgi:alkanesulfonate monooxygenase SsuD/methylene tetrahydromethanopterin reductase-like flavin-dependent oxidoreductase (luciferase family)
VRFGIFSVQDYHPELGVGQGEYFERLLARMQRAEQLGFDSFWLAEHHFHNYGLNPSPPVVLGAASRVTSRLRLGVAISVLPFRNPLHVAEDYALVDILSGGRLNFGAGSGYLKHEFEGHGIPMEERKERFDEALAIVLRAWGGERFSYEGRFRQVRDVRLQVRPVQRPHPPVWVATLRPEGAYVIGRNGFQLMGVPYVAVNRLSDMKPVIAQFKDGYAEAGQDPERATIPMALHVHVAESEAAAEREAREYLDRYVTTRLYAKRDVLWDDLRANQLVAIGAPETVAAAIDTLRDAGATDVLCLMDFGGLEQEKIGRSMELFASEVAPRFAAPTLATAGRGA